MLWGTPRFDGHKSREGDNQELLVHGNLRGKSVWRKYNEDWTATIYDFGGGSFGGVVGLKTIWSENGRCRSDLYGKIFTWDWEYLYKLRDLQLEGEML